MNVSIIIPNWNGRKLLEKNLPYVIDTKNYPDNRISEIIVVDDGSTDDSVDFISSSYNDYVRIIRHKQNRGFATAVNIGVRSAKSSLVCLLNSDVLPDRHFLKSAVSHFSDPKVFGVTLHEQGYGPATGFFSAGYVQHKGLPESLEVQNTFWVNGGSGVFRKKYWKALKGLDEMLYSPFYWEDVDLGYRAQKRGLITLWDPESIVQHNHESTINSSNFKRRYMLRIKERNHLLFVWKNITSRSLFDTHRSAVIKRIFSHPGYLVVVIMALTKYRIVRKRRNREKRESVVSDEAIFAKYSEK